MLRVMFAQSDPSEIGQWAVLTHLLVTITLKPIWLMGGCTYADLGYDCDGNFVEYVVGMEVEGGIVFYVDSSGQRGLVASFEDLEGTYEWGCFGQNVYERDEQYIGSGYQNTIDIINQGCISQNGGITAAQATLNYESNGYNDWFSPPYKNYS